jgi:hypothetical protein
VSKFFRSNLRSQARAVTIQTIRCEKGLVCPFFPIISVVTLNCSKRLKLSKCQTFCLRLLLISEVTPSLFVNLSGHTFLPIISRVTHDNQKLVYFLVSSSCLYVLSCKFISRTTLTFYRRKDRPSVRPSFRPCVRNSYLSTSATNQYGNTQKLRH